MNLSQTATILFLLSGEHETLPKAELYASLEAEGVQYSVREELNQGTIIDVNPSGAILATKRSALVNLAQLVLFDASMVIKDIRREMRNVDVSQWIQPNSRFGVRVTRLRREKKLVDVEELQRQLGSDIWGQLKGKVKVDLKKPDVWFLGIIYGQRFFFGPLVASRNREGYLNRRGPLRPFFSPCAIDPKVARVMVNLSRTSGGDLFLDPFCGTGGLLLEAALVGSRPIGLDIDVAMSTGCRQNLIHYDLPSFGGLADARAPPIRSNGVDAIATDPPYGRSSSTKGEKIGTLIRDSQEPLSAVLKPGGYLCFALPLKRFKEDLILSSLFSVVESYTMRIHRSLYRHILVLRRR